MRIRQAQGRLRRLCLAIIAITFLVVAFPANAAQQPAGGIHAIQVLPEPTLLALDPTEHEVYVRSKGLTDRYGNSYADAGFTALDARSGRVLHVWRDTGGNPSVPISFVRTSNGLRAYTTVIPALERSAARVDIGTSTDLVDEIYDAQSGWAAFVTASGPPSLATAKLWVFDLKSGLLRATAPLPSIDEVGMAIDAPANRLLVYLYGGSQLFTLDTLRLLKSIPNGGPHGYPRPPAEPNSLELPFDPEPIAVDPTLGRAIQLDQDPNNLTAQVIDLRNGHILYRIPEGPQPIAVQADSVLHRAYIADYQSGDVEVVDLRTGTQVADVQVGAGPSSLAVDARTGEVFVANSLGSTVTMFPANISQ